MAQKQSVWETSNYYEKACEGSLDIDHPGTKLLVKLSTKRKRILDLGCGEGTRLSLIAGRGVGIDISRKAIKIAREKFPKLKFIKGDLEKLPFEANSFDMVYSAYVFEHLTNPERVLSEAKRVLIKNGDLVIICPNYGAPNRSSPPFRGSRFNKILSGFIRDLIYLFKKVGKLNWNKVTPIADDSHYYTDWDVTIEPYSLTLEKYLSDNGFRIMKNISTWEYELDGAKFHQKVFKLLAKLGVYPFTFWSPHIVIQVRKT